tara:strand:+ start:2651 stop:3124 length:474 start_codon:yes stop_codon:yes gene_type:complete
MNKNYLNIYNNLIKLTRNKNIFENLSKQETFSDRLIILMLHFAFFIKLYKKKENKDEFQDLHDFFFKQLELSIREIGYGDVSINKKMKEYVNTFYFIIKKIDIWKDISYNEKMKFLSNLLNINENSNFFIEYFDKYVNFLENNTFIYFTKDVIKHNF